MGSKSAIGIGNGICFKQVRDKGGGSYIDPLVRDSIVGLWKFDQNTNESPTRNIIKNTIKDKGGDLELLNFAYKANSGYNGYPEDFTIWNYNSGLIVSPTKFQNNGDAGRQLIYYHTSIRKEDVLEFKAKITLDEQSKIKYWYIKEDGTGTNITYSKSGTYTIPTSYFSKYTGENTWFGFEQLSGGCIIEQLPLYEGALVTDGKDDMIVSQKTVQEMGITNEITVVSMIHQITLNSRYNYGFTNYIRDYNLGSIRNKVVNVDKTGIYGYTYKDAVKYSVINNILGDKNDYTAETTHNFKEAKFSVEGFINNGSPDELSEVAVYWTFISNKVLTTDEINQIIGYFKLDKYVTPQVIYDVKRQGLTNDTPAADWYLKDFSGNGHDMQLYNYAKTPESGINEDGGLQSDGIDDYGKAEGLPIFKDYTVAADRAIVDGFVSRADGGVFTKGADQNSGAFAFDYKDEVHSFGAYISKIVDTKRFISYQSKYINNGKSINAGTIVDTNPLVLAKLGSENDRYSALALYSMLLFPYSLSEFLLERQLKKYKLGTLYPDMVEFRPILSGNIPYNKIEISQDSIVLYAGATDKTGIYLQEGSTVRVYIKPSGIDEVSKITINGIEYTDLPINVNGYYYADFPITKSPQKISYVIDEYIRFEDIVQPYPAIVNLSQDGKSITWGDKLKVGSEVTFVNHINILPKIYAASGRVLYNGADIKGWNSPIIVAKSMVFTNAHTWRLNTTEPHAIYSPQKLNIPNSSLKILGYVPDLTGKGNHGKLNNFAYTENSGVAADGSIKFDGTDDHITIPTLAHGGKCVMMKVNLQKYDTYLYDQRKDWSQYLAIVSASKTVAYNYSNQGGKTYIDGILNENIIDKDLIGITHNITVVNSGNAKSYSPNIGTSFAKGNFANMSLYEFMLFPEIPSEDEIKKLNDVMGIEGGYVESPNYYWDAYGKKNTDTDRNFIADQVSKDVANALEVKNVGYNSESGYGGKGFVPFNGDWRHDKSNLDFQFITNGIHVTKGKATLSNWFWTNNPAVKGAKTKYKITGVTFDRAIRFFNGLSEYQLVINKDGIYEVDGSLLVDGDGNLTGLSVGDNGWVGDCDIVIEQLTEYPNGLLLDGVEDHAVNNVIPAVTDFTVIAKREFPESALVNNQTFLIKGDAINGNNNINSLLMECYYGAQNYIISFSHQQIVPLEESKISWITPTSYNGNALTKGSGVDSVGLTIGRYRDLYRKAVLYKAMFYTKTIDQLSINMLKNLFERDELIDVTNPIFKKEEL